LGDGEKRRLSSTRGDGRAQAGKMEHKGSGTVTNSYGGSVSKSPKLKRHSTGSAVLGGGKSRKSSKNWKDSGGGAGGKNLGQARKYGEKD